MFNSKVLYIMLFMNMMALNDMDNSRESGLPRTAAALEGGVSGQSTVVTVLPSKINTEDKNSTVESDSSYTKMPDNESSTNNCCSVFRCIMGCLFNDY